MRNMPLSRAILAFSGLLVFAFAGRAEDVAVQGGTLDVEYTSAPGAALKQAAAKWIQNSAHAVATYYGTFTVRHAVLRIKPVDGHEVSDGYSNGWRGAIVTISLGRQATPAELAEDWQLTHEMLHLGFPN